MLTLEMSAPSQGEHELVPTEPSSSAGGRNYTLFRGHAGPVHSATFSPFGDFILSSSSDSTSRLYFAVILCVSICFPLINKQAMTFNCSSSMELKTECESGLLQGSQLPCLGCTGRSKSLKLE